MRNQTKTDEMWNGIDYPILYCPKCSKPKFVPLEIQKTKNKKITVNKLI